MGKNIRGISLISLIITIVVMIIIAAITIQNGMQRTNEARLAEHNTNISTTQEEVESYYYYKDQLPVVDLTPYPIQPGSTLEAEIIKNGEQADNFYIIDMSKLQKVSGKEGTGVGDDIYIVSATKHTVYYVRGTIVKGLIHHGLIVGNSGGLPPGGISSAPTNTPNPVNQKPIAVINMSPGSTIYTTTSITWSYSGSSDPDGDAISDYEWQLDSNAVTKSPNGTISTPGNHTMNLRVQDSKGAWSDWNSTSFNVIDGMVIKQVIEGRSGFTLVLFNDGTVEASGLNQYGQLGNSSNIGTTNANSNFTFISGLSNVKQLSAGYDFVCALLNDGTVKAWGNNRYGQLGNATNNGSDTANYTPTIISGLSNVKYITSGFYFTLAILNDGTIVGWGNNNYGQLANTSNNGTNNANPTPLVSSISNVSQLVAGVYHGVAVLSNGTIETWGNNYKGQLGNSTNYGSNNPNPTPALVSGVSNAIQVDAGYHTLVLLNNGTVMSFGDNSGGELGLGDATNRTAATAVPGLTNVKQVSAGPYDSMVLLNDGTVKACGDNNYGELGNSTNNGTSNPNSTFTAIAGLNSVLQIEIDYYNSIAIFNNTIKTWGSNKFGQLGTATNSGTSNANSTPALIMFP